MSSKQPLKRQIERCARRIEILEQDVNTTLQNLKEVISSIRSSRSSLKVERDSLVQLQLQYKTVKESGLKRNSLDSAGLSPHRHGRFRQLLQHEYRQADIDIPAFVSEISEGDVANIRTSALIERYAVGESRLSGLIGPSQMRAAANRIKTSMDQLNKDRPSSKESKDIWKEHPDWKRENALAIAARARDEFHIASEFAIQVGERNAIVSSNRVAPFSDGFWIDDVASTVADRFFLGDRGRDSADVADAMAGMAIQTLVNKREANSLSAIENDVRLMQAVAIFATPGAVAHGVAYGLFDVGRKFSNEWFGANRSLISRHYPRVGSAAAFRDVVADPEKFREVHASGAAPKIAQSSRFWGRESSERDLFVKRSAKDLIEQARHDLIDTSLRSALVSMKKSKTDYLDLGAWQKNEAVHADVFDVGDLVSKAFLSEALDAAEIQVMQASNPLAITIGLVTWISADGVFREAPLFLAMASFEAEAKTISRLAPFHLNTAWLRRLSTEYPKLKLPEIATEFALGNAPDRVFAAIMAAINSGGDTQPIVRIVDHSYVGVFDSSRSVLERRLNLKSFPELAENAIVGMLAQGAAHQISYAEYTPPGGRSRPDPVQTLAVRASLGGESFVLEGPPGTGKTQTIFEMVVALSDAGKRVLVSAAMPGAVEVIGRRLRTHVDFVICSLRPGQIDVGEGANKVDVRETKFQVVIGTPLALTGRLRADDKFDVLIIDEASQMRLSHALALAGHAKQLIVAGDSRQLQPRDSEPEAVSEMSLLMRARMAGLPAITLQEHYRSQHPSLIAWSNLYSYDSKLKPKLGPLRYGDAGFSLVYVAPARRVKRELALVNIEEADRIAEECLRWARDGRRSVGVAAMTQAQRDLIRETVEERLRGAGISAASAGEGNCFFSQTEPFFVRTAGALQGEERDVILISLGVAPDSDGRINQRVGVLSRSDSLALCNVMLSRSRLRTAVFSSILPIDIDISAMTASMFLIASILRMGAVIGALENPADRQSGIDPKTVDPRFDWAIDRLEMDGEKFYAVRVPNDPERYAFAICSREPFKPHLLTEKLKASGWAVFGHAPQFLADPKQVIVLARDQLPRLPHLPR